MALCSNCGTNNAGEAKFCVSCGNDLDIQQLPGRKPQYVEPQTMGENTPACLWCKQKAGFKEEEGKLDSKWGVTAHKVRIFICNNCGYSHLFSLGRSIWDFD